MPKLMGLFCLKEFISNQKFKLVEFGRRVVGMILAILVELETQGFTLEVYNWLTDTTVDVIILSSRICIVFQWEI